jgi:hypothetical protein
VCDTFAAVGPSGAVFAKNSDRVPGETQVVKWHARRPPGSVRTQYLELPDPGAHGAVLSRPTWLWGAEHGVNEHGLAVGNERVWSRDLVRPAALTGMDLVRLVLERAQTADEGLEVLVALLEEHGQGGSCDADHDDPYDSSFLLCDAGGGWVVETSGREWLAAPFDDHAAISNRYTLGTRWTRAAATVAPGASADEWHEPSVDTRLADHRLAVTAACAAAHPGPADAVATLRHHGTVPWGAPGRGDAPQPPPTELGDDFSGFTVCAHIPGIQATTASMVCALPPGGEPARVWACLGSPCCGLYLPLRAGAVPPFLSDPAQWHRTTRLRDRVDIDGDALAEIRAVLDPVEAELWAEADTLAEAGHDAWAAFADAAGARAAEALTRLGV